MRWSYDGESDSLYVYVSDNAVATQRELGDGTIADVAEDGSLVGFEVLSLRFGWLPNEVAEQFGLPTQARHALIVLAHALFGPSVAVKPHIAGSAAPMPELLPA